MSNFFFGFLFCFIGLAGLVVLIVLLVIVSRNQSQRRREHSLEDVRAFELLLAKWVRQDRLSLDNARQLYTLLREEREHIEHPAARGVPPTPDTSLAPLPPTPIAPPAEAEPPRWPPPKPETQPSSAADTTKPAAQGVRAGLLALRTRVTLLLLGAFLLLMSSLILVLFNWASFPPFLQFALLASVCGGFWGGGMWAGRREGLQRVGVGLQAVGGVLVPVVAFSLTRPGLLALDLSLAWLLTSVLSLPIYVLASWKLRHGLFVGAACLAGVSMGLAAANLRATPHWFLCTVILVCTGYLPLAQWLAQHHRPDLARVPTLFAFVTTLTALLLSLALATVVSPFPLAATFWAGVLFFLLATWQQQTPRWLWGVAGTLPLAVLATMHAAAIPLEWGVLALSILALAYLVLSIAFEPHLPAHTLPGYIGAAVLTFSALVAAGVLWLEGQQAVVLRWSLPVVGGVGIATLLAYHHGRFAWLKAGERVSVALLGLSLAAALLPIWFKLMLTLTSLTPAQQGIPLLLLAFLFMGAAHWWLGRGRPSYDLVLQGVGVLVGLAGGLLTLTSSTTWIGGMAIATGLWTFQTVLRRHSGWAALALGNALLLAAVTLTDMESQFHTWVATGLVFAAITLIGGTLLRKTPWRCLSLPGLFWGSGVAFLTLAAILLDSSLNMPAWLHVGEVGALMALAVAVSILGRQPRVGYAAALLFSLVVVLAVSNQPFTTWLDGGLFPVQNPIYGYALCGTTLALFLAGQAVRRSVPRYAYPYEIVAYGILTATPLFVADSAQHATMIWGMMVLLYGLATWRYRLPLLLVPTFVTFDIALIAAAAWLLPDGDPAGLSRILLAASWLQALSGVWFRLRERQQALPLHRQHAMAAYGVAILSGCAALLISSNSSATLAIVAFGLTLLLVLVATVEQREYVAGGSLLTLAMGFGSLFNTLELSAAWSLAWGVAVALALSLLGWALSSLSRSFLAVWERLLLVGPLVIGGILTAALLLVVVATDSPSSPLTFGMALLALLLGTAAVRTRTIPYGYGAGVALVGTVLSQFYDWGFRDAQWFVIPSSFYLLVLAELVRRFQEQRRVSRVIETGALVLACGTTLGQALTHEGMTEMLYALGLCGESLLLLGYGVLRKLRVPFVGGIAFFVAGVVWLSIDPLMAANKWVLFGLSGLLLVGIYVLLEQKQEQLVRTGHAWMEQLKEWG